MSAREMVEAALGPLRTGYVFPDLAEPAAAAIEVRLAAGEYDGMDEAAHADLRTTHLNDICAHKHLRARASPPRPPQPDPPPPSAPPPPPRHAPPPPPNTPLST